jgi:hypothetical protein
MGWATRANPFAWVMFIKDFDYSTNMLSSGIQVKQSACACVKAHTHTEKTLVYFTHVNSDFTFIALIKVMQQQIFEDDKQVYSNQYRLLIT